MLPEELGKVPTFPTVSVNNTRTGFFEESEVRKLVKHLPSTDGAVVVFAFHTGWRIRSEVLPLTWFQVDFEEGIVRLEPGTTKSGEGREFPFKEIPELDQLLRKLKSKAAGPMVFQTTYRPFLERWRQACRKIGKTGAWPHDLRRSAVGYLERSGVSRSVAMNVTGHKTESVYRRYAIVATSDLREGVRKWSATTTGRLLETL